MSHEEKRNKKQKIKRFSEKYLNQLLKRSLLVAALDAILPCKGLLKHVQLGSLDISLSNKCEEVTLTIHDDQIVLMTHCL